MVYTRDIEVATHSRERDNYRLRKRAFRLNLNCPPYIVTQIESALFTCSVVVWGNKVELFLTDR